MTPEIQPTLYDPDLAGFAAWLIVFGLAAIWIGMHWATRFLQARWWRPIVFAIRVAIGWCCLWALFQSLGRVFHLATPWPYPLIAIIGAAAIEIMAELYRRDARVTGPGRLGAILLVLRSLAVLVVLAMLLEPIVQLTRRHEWKREVVVMVDDSGSMQLIDERVDPTLAFDIAAFRGRPVNGRTALWDLWESVSRWESRIFGQWADDNALTKAQEEIRTQMAPEASKVCEPLLEAKGEATPDLKALWRTAEQELRQMAEAKDEKRWSQLSEAERRSLTQLARDRRADLAAAASLGDAARGDGLLEKLSDKFDVRVYQFADDVQAIEDWRTHAWSGEPSGTDDAFRSRTDLTQALEHVLATSSERTLAGAVILSDGRHNGRRPWLGTGRLFGARKLPIGTVAFGTLLPPLDSMIRSVDAPARIYLGESVNLEAHAAFAGMDGKSATINAYADDRLIDSIDLTIREPDERHTLRFAHVPEATGEIVYRVEVLPTEQERILDNNSVTTTVRVEERPPEPEEEPEETKAVEVLLVDGLPRWEFRYLRNLLDGRDPSVELQHVLTRPESISGIGRAAGRAALASRPFGESHATSLPRQPLDWLEFDVIILGDFSPEAIGDPAWAAIEKAVSENGALLIIVAGRHAMPHRFRNPHFHTLLPVQQAGTASENTAPFQIVWTPDGEASKLPEVADDSLTSRLVWNSAPAFTWRLQAGAPKRNAKVLAYAVPANSPAQAGADPDSLAFENPLIVSQRIGEGRVVFFQFDSTWRLRYGADDRYHHRFWWQLLHWKVEPEDEEMLSPDDFSIELATDQETYRLGDPIHVKAKIRGPDDAPVSGVSLEMQIEREGRHVSRHALLPRAGFPGVYDAVIEKSLPEPGIYRITLDGGGSAFGRLVELGVTDAIETTFTVQPGPGLELQQLTADHETLEVLAALSGGRFVRLPQSGSLVELFGPPKLIDERIEETTLWDRPIFIIIFVSLLSLEWMLRRKTGLV